ncbi:MAG: ATP-binding cassette domain-containing protein [Gammaproteobacteria bacterium]|jgi:putative ABC transport system ATP-binding protein
MLRIENVSLTVPSCEKNIINNVTFEVHQGDFIILLGSNGSGKSSLLNLISRVYLPKSGSIELFNKFLHRYSHKTLTEKVITLTQNTNDNLFMDMTIAENGILFELRNKNKSQHQLDFQEYLAQFHLGLAERIDIPVNKLSGGERQILILALALRHQPDLILLDEHTSALDPKTAAMIMEKTYQEIIKRGITCIMATHNLDFALQYGNRLLAINNGKIVHMVSAQNKPNLTKQDLLADCY